MTGRSTRRTTRRRKSPRRTLLSRKSLRKSPRPEYPTLETVLTYFFNVGGHEIRKTEPGYEPPTAKDFLQEVQDALRSSTQSGGSNKVRLFTQKLVGANVGTFDTPCNKFLSYFAIAVWAAFFYTLVVSFFQFPSSQIIDAIANPVFVMIELLQGSIGSGDGPTQELKANIRTFVESIAPNIPSMASTGIQHVIFFVFNSEGYKRLVDSSLACLLLRLGVFSCSEKCNKHILLNR